MTLDHHTSGVRLPRSPIQAVATEPDVARRDANVVEMAGMKTANIFRKRLRWDGVIQVVRIVAAGHCAVVLESRSSLTLELVLVLTGGKMARTVLHPRPAEESSLPRLCLAIGNEANDGRKQQNPQRAAQDSGCAREVKSHQSVIP